MKYQIITVSAAFSFKKSVAKLVEEVNTAIAQGWEPVGGVTFTDTKLMQAMIRKR